MKLVQAMCANRPRKIWLRDHSTLLTDPHPIVQLLPVLSGSLIGSTKSRCLQCLIGKVVLQPELQTDGS